MKAGTILDRFTKDGHSYCTGKGVFVSCLKIQACFCFFCNRMCRINTGWTITGLDVFDDPLH